MWHGFDSAIRGLSVVVGSRFAPRVFLQVLWFSSLHKNEHSKFQFDQDGGPARKPAAKADVASSLNIVIYFILRACEIRASSRTRRYPWPP